MRREVVVGEGIVKRIGMLAFEGKENKRKQSVVEVIC